MSHILSLTFSSGICNDVSWDHDECMSTQKTKPLSDCICLTISSPCRCSADKSISTAVTGLYGATAMVKPSPCISLFKKREKNTSHRGFFLHRQCEHFQFIFSLLLHSKPGQTHTQTHIFYLQFGFKKLGHGNRCLRGGYMAQCKTTLLVKKLKLVNKNRTGTNIQN